MGQINVTVGGRSYPLACRDGEEERLTKLAQHLARKADDLSAALGQMSEPRLLLMAGILVADELHELRENQAVPQPAGSDSAIVDALLRAAERIERLADTLEHDAAGT